MLCGLLPEGMMFPFDFGFVPSTLGDDGDPLDILVLMDAPAHVGCLIDVRIIGIITAEQTEEWKTETNDRLLGVAVHSYDHQDLTSINAMSKTLLDQLEQLLRFVQQATREEVQSDRHGRAEKSNSVCQKRNPGPQEL